MDPNQTENSNGRSYQEFINHQNNQNSQTPPLSQQKPFYKTNAFIVLFLFLFWPLGLFLMWKYTKWRMWVKVVLTIWFSIGMTILITLNFFFFILLSYYKIDDLVNPPKINHTLVYKCQATNATWGNCVNDHDNFSVEYPAKWNYFESKDENHYNIHFNPLSKFGKSESIVSIGVYDFKNDNEARDFVKGSSISRRKQVIVNGNYGAIEENTYSNGDLILFGVIQNGRTTYSFNAFQNMVKQKHIPLSNKQLTDIFEHMFYSFKLKGQTGESNKLSISQAEELVNAGRDKYDQAMQIQNPTPEEKIKKNKLISEAISDFTQASQLDPQNYNAWHQLGLAYLNFQDGDPNWSTKGINAMNKAISLNPNQYISYLVLGEIYVNSKDYKNGIKNYQEVIRLNPNFGPAYLELGYAYMQIGDKVQAKQILTKSLELLPANDTVRREWVQNALKGL